MEKEDIKNLVIFLLIVLVLVGISYNVYKAKKSAAPEIPPAVEKPVEKSGK